MTRRPLELVEVAESLSDIALRFFADSGALPTAPRSKGRRAIYARDLLELRQGLAWRLAGALSALKVRRKP